MICRIFGDDTPEKYERKDGEGCICNRKQLDKIFAQNEKAWMEDTKTFVDCFKAERKNKT